MGKAEVAKKLVGSGPAKVYFRVHYCIRLVLAFDLARYGMIGCSRRW